MVPEALGYGKQPVIFLRKVANMDKKTERLPFRVEIATDRDMHEVARLRSFAYGRHLPGLGEALQKPEPADYAPGCQVFVARSKLDGEMLGTLRTHANIHRSLPLEASIELPTRLSGSLMVETTRLSILGGEGASLVRNALFKALHSYCLEQKVDWMLATGRRPVDRIYDGLLFKDVMEPGAYYPMVHVAGVPHRVMMLSPVGAQALWAAHKHPLFEFMVETYHPDIDLSLAGSLQPSQQPVPVPVGIRPLPAPLPARGRRWASFGLGLAAA